jgi:hypothetical protein
LNEGLEALGDQALDLLDPFFPAGDYAVGAFEVWLERTQDGAANDPFRTMLFAENRCGTCTPYYISTPRPLAPGVRLFEFFLPLQAEDGWEVERGQAYAASLKAGWQPTLLALSQIQTRVYALGECARPAFDVCLLHFLLEGQDKAEAASRVRGPIRLLSFLNLGESIGGVNWALKARYGLDLASSVPA